MVRRAAGTVVFMLCACAGDYQVRIHLPPEAAGVVRVEVFLIASCEDVASPGDPPQSIVREVVVDEGSAGPPLGHVDSGSYGLYARAWDAQCHLVAAGCNPVRVEEGGEGVLDAFLVATSSRSCDPGHSCKDGACEQSDAAATEDRDAGPDASDAGSAPDGGSCVDEDGDGACAGVDCDDSDPARSPRWVEFCPDYRDNDCDDLVDFSDACEHLPDRCEEPFAVLQQADGSSTFWRFEGLPLDEQFEDDFAAELSAGGAGDCEATSGSGGGDIVFKVIATADSDLEVTVSGGLTGDPVVYFRTTCNASAGDDVCAEGSSPEVTLRAVMAAGDERMLFVDENVPGPVDVTVMLQSH